MKYYPPLYPSILTDTRGFFTGIPQEKPAPWSSRFVLHRARRNDTDILEGSIVTLCAIRALGDGAQDDAFALLSTLR